MHPYLIKWLTEQANKRKHISDKTHKVSDYVLLREFERFRLLLRQLLRSSIVLAAGACSAALGLLGFLLPNDLIDGGAVGIALLLSQLTTLSFPVLFMLVSLPFILIGWRIISIQFAIKAAVSIILLTVLVAVGSIPDITDDKLLVAVFGGFFLGLGIGLVMRGGGVLDGTEVLALVLSRRLNMTVGDVILIINVMIFALAAWMLSVETALYSLLTYLVAAKTVDFILEGIEEYTGITVISPRAEEIREMITEKLGRGVTIYNGKRGFGSHGHRHKDIDILYTVVTRLEVNRLTSEIQLIDEHAFIVMQSVKDTRGGMIKKRSHKHF